MKLNTFEWHNGTESNPIVLTTEQIQTLCDIKESVETVDVSGYITSNKPIPDYLKYAIEETYTGIHYVGETVTSTPNVYVERVVMPEGSNTKILNRAGNIPIKYLNFEIIEHNIKRLDNTITDSQIENSITIANGEIISSKPTNNSSWSDTLKVKAISKFNIQGDYCEFSITIQAIGIDSVQITTDNKIQHRTNVHFEYKLNPVDVSSAFVAGLGQNYVTKNEIVNVEYSATNNIFVDDYGWSMIPTLEGDNTFNFNLTVRIRLGSSTEILCYTTKTFIVGTKFVEGLVSSIQLVQMQKNVKTQIKGSFVKSSPDWNISNNVFCWLRENSIFVFGKYNEPSNSFRYKKLYKYDRRYYDNNGERGELAPISEFEGNYNGFVKLPEFWYKFDKTISTLNQSTDEEFILYDITFTVTNSANNILDEDGNLSGDWMHWDGNTLIGIWNGSIDNNGQYRSISNKIPYVYKTINNIALEPPLQFYKNSINIDTYTIIQWLFFAWYGDVDSQAICGTGSHNYLRIGGNTDGLGFTDTTPENANYGEGVNLENETGPAGSNTDLDLGNIKNVNFWGIENLWGNVPTVVNNIICVNIVTSSGSSLPYLVEISSNFNGSLNFATFDEAYAAGISRIFGVIQGTYHIPYLLRYNKYGVILKQDGAPDAEGMKDVHSLYSPVGHIMACGCIDGGIIALGANSNAGLNSIFCTSSGRRCGYGFRLCEHYDNFEEVENLS